MLSSPLQPSWKSLYALNPQCFPPTPTPGFLFLSSSCRDGVEDVDSQGDGSSQPDTISIASRTSQNTVDSDKVGQSPNLPSTRLVGLTALESYTPPEEFLPLWSLTSGAGSLCVPTKGERAGLEEVCHSMELLSEGSEGGAASQTAPPA